MSKTMTIFPIPNDEKKGLNKMRVFRTNQLQYFDSWDSSDTSWCLAYHLGCIFAHQRCYPVVIMYWDVFAWFFLATCMFCGMSASLVDFLVFFLGDGPTTTRMFIKPFIDGGDAWELRLPEIWWALPPGVKHEDSTKTRMTFIQWPTLPETKTFCPKNGWLKEVKFPFGARKA